MSAIVAIPARIKSTRFPGKVLADIHGNPMLWHVYQGVSQATSITDIWVVTDSQEVFDLASSWGARALMTSEDCPSGTARIASVADQLKAEIVVNVQGDEPMITGQVVDTLVASLQVSDADIVLFDPDANKKQTLDDLHADSDYSIWEGFQTTGYPVTTILRGKVIVENGQLRGSASDGRWLNRKVDPSVLARPVC